jgi:hypothetical protein
MDCFSVVVWSVASTLATNHYTDADVTNRLKVALEVD